MDLMGVLEGILFVVGDEGITLAKLSELLDLASEEVEKMLFNLNQELDKPNRGFKIEFLGNRYKLVTKAEHKDYYKKLVDVEKNEPLSQAALETLAIIAYNGPVTRMFVDEIRGVDSAHMIRKLAYRNLIYEVGRSDLPGKPILYNVTDEFLDYLGLSSIKELPALKDIEEKEIDDNLDLYESRYHE